MVSLGSAYASMATSSATPIGSTVFLTISFVTICLLTLLLLRRFLTLRATPAHITVPVFLALVLPASVVLLVPVDLTSSSRENGKATNGVWLPSHAVLVLWRITYWLIFCLTWIILPLLGDFVDSGYRDSKSRLMYSLRSNARYHLIVLGCGIVGLIYISVQNGFDFTSIRSLIMALAYVWGLVLAIYLMGHGLVSIPRSFFRKSNNANALRRIQAHAPKIHDHLTDAITELEEVEAQVARLQRRKTGSALVFEDWIEELADYSNMPDSRPAALHSLVESTAVPAVITERYLAGLSRRLQRARHQKARFVDEWDRLVRSAADYQTILNSVASKKLDFDSIRSPEAGTASRRGCWTMTPYMRYVIYVYVFPNMQLVMGAAFAIASFCVVWSEVIKTFAPKLSIISLSLIPDPEKSSNIGLGGQLIASFWLLYMCTAALRGVNDAQVWGNRALVRRNTYGESACWYAGQVARLTVPLAYNFLTFLPRELREDTTFYQFLGRYIDLTPLGKGFDYFFPIFLLVPVCATMFNLYGRIKKIFGLGFVDDEEDPEADPGGFGTGGWREGRALIERELVGLGSLGLTSRSLGPGRDTGSASSPSLNLQRAASPQPGWSSSSSIPRSSSRAPLIGPSSSPDPTTATAVIDDGVIEEENFFQSFAHRVRNTIETASTPQWLQGGFANISTPRWLNSGGLGRSDNANGSTPGGNRIFGGLFGQRTSNGHVRL